MVSQEAFELAVKLSSEGIDETEQDLQGVEGQFDDTADSVGDSARDMEGFSTRWRGAMTAIVAGLGIATGFLLSRVPVVGETMDGLNAVIGAVAFNLDESLRPAMGDVNDELFELSDSLFEADDAAEGFIDTLETIDNIESIVVEAAVDFSLDLTAEDVARMVFAVLRRGARGATGEALREVIQDRMQEAIEDGIGNVDSRSIAGRIIGTLASAIREAPWVVVGILFGESVSNAVRGIDWRMLGRAIIDRIIDGLSDRLSALKRMADRVVSAIRDRLPSSRAKEGPWSDASPSEIGQNIGSGIEGGLRQSIPRVKRASNQLAGGARPQPGFAAGRDQDLAVFLDGRKINDNQGRFQAGDVTLRGR